MGLSVIESKNCLLFYLTFLGQGGGELGMGITILSDSICRVPESRMSWLANCAVSLWMAEAAVKG